VSEKPKLQLSPEPEPTWKEWAKPKSKSKSGRMPRSKAKAKPHAVEREPEPAAMGDAAGLSLHAMIMAELEALGCIARPGSGPELERGRGDEQDQDSDPEPEPGPEHDRDGGGEGDGESQRGLHHLHYDRTKGWMLRVTVDLGKNVIGKRLKFRLRTRDAGEAEKARDLVLATLKRLGLTVRLRMQGRGRG